MAKSSSQAPLYVPGRGDAEEIATANFAEFLFFFFFPRTSVNGLSSYFAFIVVHRNPLHCEQQSVSEGGYEGSRSISRARVTSNGSMHLSSSSTGPYLHLHISEWKKGK